MPRTIVYRAGGFTNCGIGYTRFSQEELAEMKDRAMTESEAIKFLKERIELINSDYPDVVDYKNALECAIRALEEVQQYREIGTPEECRAAVEKQNVNKELESHDEKHILECCISLMQEMVDEFAEWYRWQHGEDAIKELDEEERFCFRKSHFSIVQELFLSGTHHSGGTSTRAKCEQLGVDSSEENM